MTFLLSWHGQLLCREPGGGFVQRPVEAVGTAEPVAVPLAWDRVRSDFDRSTRTDDNAMTVALPAGLLGGFTLTVEARRRWVHLEQGGLFLSAAPDGRVSLDRRKANAWERFLPLTPADLDHLRFLRANAWVVRSTLRVLRAGEVRLIEGHRIAFGDALLYLPHQLPFDLSLTPMRVTLLQDGWRIEQACLYRPLVFSTAIRKPGALAQLWLALRSLVEVARYDGHVHLLTDQSQSAVLRSAPFLDAARLSVQRVAASDRMGAIASKFSIVDWPQAAAFQPLLFVDADTIFDADLTPMLAAIAASDRMAAPIEDFSPMRTALSAGAKLLVEDGFNPQDASGFNSGTLGIPNLHEHAHVLRIMRRIIVNRADIFGRRSFTWVDQPVANYVSHRLAHVDTYLLNRFVRYGFPGVETTPGRQQGLVHFWPPMSDEAKLQAMRTYLELLQDAPRPPPPLD